MMKRKKWLVFSVFVFMLIGIFGFFLKNNYKTAKFGNTNSKSSESIKEYILNLESYEAQMEVEVHSNKNQNQYKMKQTYKSPNTSYQEILEPDTIKGLTTKYDGKTLSIENTKLHLSKIYENYPYATQNNLWLSGFIEDYKNNEKATLKEEENQVILETKVENPSSKECFVKTLYIDKKTAKPTKLTIEDKNQKKQIYILYNEIKIKSSR